MADDKNPEVDADELDEAISSTSTYEDDETATRAEVEPDPEAGEPAGDEGRAVAWRPGRRAGVRTPDDS